MHKLFKQSFSLIMNSLRGLQFLLILLSLLTMIDFVLFLIKVKLPAEIQVVFDTIYNIQSAIYKPDLEAIPVDFTLAIAAIEFLLIAGALVYVMSFLVEFEQAYDKVHRHNSKRYEEKFNQSLKTKVEKIESSNKSFALLYSISLENALKSEFFGNSNKDVNFEQMVSDYKINFRNLMLQNFKMTYQQLENNEMLLFFEDINDCNGIFNKVFEFSKNIKEDLKPKGIKFSLKTAVCMADRRTSKSSYMPKLQKLINIEQPNAVMSLSDFKTKYEQMGKQEFTITGIGEYTLEGENIDVYTFTKPVV